MATDPKYPLVTIVTPSYNQGRFIEETIKSVLSQDYPHIEYLVIDGGSTDNTLEVVKKYEDRLTFLSEKDNGQSDAINKGFRMAKGEIVAWLNSDDTYEPGAIKRAVEYMLKHPEVKMVYGEGYNIDGDGCVIERFGATQPFDMWDLVNVWDYILQPTVFMDKKALFEVGLLNEDLHWCMDWDLWIRIGNRFKIGYVPDYIANSRIYAETKTSSGGLPRIKEILSVMRKYSGKRYPFGYFIYALHTYEEVCRDKWPAVYEYLLKAPFLSARKFVDLRRQRILSRNRMTT